MNNCIKQTASKATFYLLKQKNVIFSWSSTQNVARLAPFRHLSESLIFLNLEATLEEDKLRDCVFIFLLRLNMHNQMKPNIKLVQ